ncbi:carbohydrate kinase [Sinomonas atrocyanea]|uniref:Carbohydrate kinase n=1 Tax=Sinomonas atrocyanea TaxID=37927 RepID=A0A127A5K8_9MICC|nr:sugar kinase [Sinomonas atrocyanea]AMM34437.1 carbohydrate kinase [Sinomonas atrocyanea]GEB65839.1 carbohydrate kinase [Sinomonas atrocyanea]GGG61057.1 carbohydrate kinase [Sinomonas atrocyanea]
MLHTSNPRLITIGETMMMVTPARAESLATADDVSLHPGGAESNVACHTAHLGIPSAWVSAVGDDVLGRRLVRAIQERGVDTRWVTADPEAPTGVYFKDPGHGVLYYRRGSAASRMSPATVADIPLEDADIVHLSGITPVLSASCAALVDAVIDRVAASDATLTFDVNYRPSLWPEGVAAGVLRQLANRADVVFVGLDEAQALWGCATPDDVRDLLPGPDRVVVKDGDVGATELGRDGTVFEPAIPTEVLEAVGAGDAFAAGYLAADLNGAGASGRLRAGHERARLVLLSMSDFVADPPAAASAALTQPTS